MKGASSRFATADEVRSPEFAAINKVLDQISVSFHLPDHADVNALRYPWSRGMLSTPEFYAARLWEYPYAILAAELVPGLKVADIGCGMTAFTIYLKEHAGCDVTGVDPDVFEAGVRYKGHGVSEEFVKRTGIKFLRVLIPDSRFLISAFRRFFRTIVVTIDTSSLASQASAWHSAGGPIRQASYTRSLIHDSRHAFNAIEHFEMKSRSLSAARASSSIPATEVLLFTS
jgi:hypothetical protein